MEERDRALQQVLSRAIGPVRLCQELPVTVIETMQDYALLKLDNIDVKDMQILRRTNSETGDVRAVFIPWPRTSLSTAIEYANRNFSSEDFPIPS
ncbi:hypothetical protein IQ241_13810 [Romeria aff. gracilis LEGE 07310]|uniref:Uncharacterized protein n=1 Tax=Vasconcelosia minhoensis LEGE 07310 TaxID=915328 RepID=A0A8J7AFJ8_9CYAN|nr:hypothetical protein [Romeria gracilis]MBE9078356.1 hypothetical protein [Romeria aff. gracilis LEGE 07310]